MPRYIDITGQRFGRLVAVRYQALKWQCNCDCGNETTVPSTDLRNGKTQSCGCLLREKVALLYVNRPSQILDLTGQHFGRLTALEIVGRAKNRGCQWLCECTCGDHTIVSISSLRSGKTKSCGCLLRDHAREVGHLRLGKASYLTHGKSGTRTYQAWINMFSRCYNENSPQFKYWGGRGIIVCYRWRKFENFFADMGEAPPGLSLDRYPNNDGNYEPTNCRWATSSQQRHNQRR